MLGSLPHKLTRSRGSRRALSFSCLALAHTTLLCKPYLHFSPFHIDFPLLPLSCTISSQATAHHPVSALQRLPCRNISRILESPFTHAPCHRMLLFRDGDSVAQVRLVWSGRRGAWCEKNLSARVSKQGPQQRERHQGLPHRHSHSVANCNVMIACC